MIAVANNSVEHAELLLQQRRLDAACAAFHQAEADGADRHRCSAGRWLADMLRGDFEAAWQESDSIRRTSLPDPHRFWQGEDLTGKRVILRSLHGFGDAVQMLRYVPRLVERAASLTLEVAPRMVALAGMFQGVREVITWGEDAPLSPPAWDVQLEINELPYLFRTCLDDLPIAERYLELPHTLSKEPVVVPLQSGSLRVGLVWASSEWNTARSVPIHHFNGLLQTEDAEFWNLQGGRARAMGSRFVTLPNMHAADQCAHSLTAFASTIAQLDLVLTPDTLAAHLAGALGVPAWVMLEHAADWRWLHEREDSPWYPSLRLFRQPEPGDWRSVIRSIELQLQVKAASHLMDAGKVHPC